MANANRTGAARSSNTRFPTARNSSTGIEPFRSARDADYQAFHVPSGTVDPARTSLDPAKIDAVLGRKGELNKRVYKVTIGREVKMAGHNMGNAMGVNTWAAFAGSDDQAIVDGDFAMLEGEMQGVLKALRHAGINIVAIHQHMTGESPLMMFLHYCGVGKTEDLARGLKSALGQTRS